MPLAFFDHSTKFFLLIRFQDSLDAFLPLLKDGFNLGTALPSDLAHGEVILMDDGLDLRLLLIVKVEFPREFGN